MRVQHRFLPGVLRVTILSFLLQLQQVVAEVAQIAQEQETVALAAQVVAVVETMGMVLLVQEIRPQHLHHKEIMAEQEAVLGRIMVVLVAAVHLRLEEAVPVL